MTVSKDGMSERTKVHALSMTLKSIITCPQCGHRAEETMPTNACVFFYKCSQCGAQLKPKSGDCCVFCSYGSVPCPPLRFPNVKKVRTPRLQGLDPGEMTFLDFPFRLKKSRKRQKGTGPCRLRGIFVILKSGS